MADLTGCTLTLSDLDLRHRLLHRIHVCFNRYQRVRGWIPAEVYHLYMNCMTRFIRDITEVRTSERMNQLAPTIRTGLDEIDRVLRIHITRSFEEEQQGYAGVS